MILSHQQKLDKELEDKVKFMIPSCKKRYKEYIAILEEKPYSTLQPFTKYTLRHILYEGIKNQGFTSFRTIMYKGWCSILNTKGSKDKETRLSKEVTGKWIKMYYDKTKNGTII